MLMQQTMKGILHGTVDHEGSGVQKTHRASVDDLAAVINLDQVGLLDHGKSHSKRVHPEGGWINRVLGAVSLNQNIDVSRQIKTYANGDVAGYALVKTVLATRGSATKIMEGARK